MAFSNSTKKNPALGQKRRKKWVHWLKLPNPAFRETAQDVVDWLRAKGYMQPDCTKPTARAFRAQLAKNTGACIKWNSTRYLSDRRNERRAKKRAQMALEGP